MPVRSSGLALLAVAGITIALTACASIGAGITGVSGTKSATGGASPTASTAATDQGAAIPAGYQRVGGPAQGISLATPKSWVPVNLAKESIDNAARRLAVPGIDAAVLEADMRALQKHHAIFAFDVASASSDPDNFTRNLNAYCFSSGVNDTGSAGVPFLKQEAKSEMGTVASEITQRDLTIGGVPGVETTLKLNSASGVDVRGSQLAVLPKPNVACIVTLSYTSSEGAGNYLNVAAATAQFP